MWVQRWIYKSWRQLANHHKCYLGKTVDMSVTPSSVWYRPCACKPLASRWCCKQCSGWWRCHRRSRPDILHCRRRDKLFRCDVLKDESRIKLPTKHVLPVFYYGCNLENDLNRNGYCILCTYSLASGCPQPYGMNVSISTILSISHVFKLRTKIEPALILLLV